MMFGKLREIFIFPGFLSSQANWAMKFVNIIKFQLLELMTEWIWVLKRAAAWEIPNDNLEWSA